MTKPGLSDYSKTSRGAEELIQGNLSLGKLIFLAMISMALSAFGPLSIFAPVPMGIAFLLYGNSKTFMVAGGVTVVLLTLAFSVPGLKDNILIVGVFCIALFYAFLISRAIVNKVEPMKGLLSSGFSVLAVFGLGLGLHSVFGEVSLEVMIKQYVVEAFGTIKSSPQYQNVLNAGGQEALDLQSFLDNPQKIVTQALQWSFAAIFVGTFIGLWTTLFMLLRNALVWRHKYDYPYTVKELIHFKTPEVFVWPLILGLVFVVGGDYITPGDKTLEVVGGNLLYCMAVFYFFQGFGIFIQLLDHLKFVGFFRTMIIICSVFMGWQVIVVVGVFDLWLNFRKFFEKKENEGDNL